MAENFLNLKEVVLENYKNNKTLTDESLNEYLDNLLDNIKNDLLNKFNDEEYKYRFLMQLILITTILGIYVQKSVTPEFPVSIDELDNQFMSLSKEDDLNIQIMKSFYFEEFNPESLQLTNIVAKRFELYKSNLSNKYNNLF